MDGIVCVIAVESLNKPRTSQRNEVNISMQVGYRVYRMFYRTLCWLISNIRYSIIHYLIKSIITVIDCSLLDRFHLV